ncbi:hypothetical protein Tco_1473342 [Tanacetum coccineum]
MAPIRRTTRSTPVTTTPPPVADPTTTTSVTSAQLQAMIDQGVTAVLAARDTTRNGDDSHTSGTGVRRNERAVRECTYQDFMKCQPLFFRGIEGVVDLTQWFERMETVFRISNCTVENQVKFATCTLMGIALTWWNSHEPTSPHPLNPLLDNISDVPPRPLNPQPLQSHLSLDITLFLSPITPLNHIHEPPSPP